MVTDVIYHNRKILIHRTLYDSEHSPVAACFHLIRTIVKSAYKAVRNQFELKEMIPMAKDNQVIKVYVH